MELKKILTCVFAVLFVLLLQPGAKAQERNLRVSLSGGGSFLKGERAFIIGGDGFGSRFLNGGRFRVGITSDFSEQWAAEFNYGFGHNKLRITEFDSLLVPDIRDFELTVHQLGINGFRYFLDPESRFRPFATAGIGLTRFSPTDLAAVIALAVDFTDDPAVLEASNKLSFSFGGGVEAKLHEIFGARLTLKDYISGFPRLGVPETATLPGTASFPVSGTVNNIELTVGVLFYLDPLFE